MSDILGSDICLALLPWKEWFLHKICKGRHSSWWSWSVKPVWFYIEDHNGVNLVVTGRIKEIWQRFNGCQAFRFWHQLLMTPNYSEKWKEQRVTNLKSIHFIRAVYSKKSDLLLDWTSNQHRPTSPSDAIWTNDTSFLNALHPLQLHYLPWFTPQTTTIRWVKTIKT